MVGKGYSFPRGDRSVTLLADNLDAGDVLVNNIYQEKVVEALTKYGIGIAVFP